MSLATNVANLATRIATEFKALRTLVNGTAADLSALQAEVAQVADSAVAIDDDTTGPAATWSSAKISDHVAVALDSLAAGAPAALDTLAELAAALENDADFGASVTAALSARVRVDAEQLLTGAQQAQGRANLGAASAADLGDPATDLVSIFEAGLV